MKSVKVRLLLLLAALLAGLLLFAAPTATNAQDGGDGPLVDLGTFVGPFDVLMTGVGTELNFANTVTVNVPGDVEAAYLLWTLRDRGDLSDNRTITMNINGTGETITADRFYQGDAFGPIDNFVYVEDITAQLSALALDTDHTIGLDGIELEAGRALFYGFGVVVVHENPLLGDDDQVVIDLKEGLDYLYHGFNDEIGSPSSINCSFFTAEQLLDDDGQIEITMFAAGVEPPPANQQGNTGFRPNNLYYTTGVVANEAALPPAADITGTGTQIVNPFFSANQPEWDTFSTNVELPAGDNYVCFQLESPETGPDASEDGGASILWLANSVKLSYEAGTAITLTDLSGNELQIGMMWLMVVFVLLMSATLYFGLLKQRQ